MAITKESIDALIKEIEADENNKTQFDALAVNSELLCKYKGEITALLVTVATAYLGKGGALIVKAGLDRWFSKHCG